MTTLEAVSIGRILTPGQHPGRQIEDLGPRELAQVMVAIQRRGRRGTGSQTAGRFTEPPQQDGEQLEVVQHRHCDVEDWMTVKNQYHSVNIVLRYRIHL